MELSLRRRQLTQVGSTARDTMRVLPSKDTDNKTQKLVVGDDGGQVSCFKFKKGDSQLVFQTPQLEKPISALTLGGPHGHKDLIYVAYGQVIQGYKKKGKDFFKFPTNLSVPIHHMLVEDTNIWTAGDCIYNKFEQCKDSDFFVSADRINHFTLFRGDRGLPQAVLGCQDKHVRVITGSDLDFECDVSGPVSALMAYHNNAAAQQGLETEERQILYGCDDGTIGQLLVGGRTMRRGFVSSEKRTGGVNCMTALDITKDGVPDLCIGRDDGLVEVFGFDQGTGRPVCEFSSEQPESITSIDTGRLVALDSEEIVVSTYSGKILSFSHEDHSTVNYTSHRAAQGGQTTEAEVQLHAQKNHESIQSTRKEIDALKEKLAWQREKYQKHSQELIAVQKQFAINKSFKLLAEEACYLITIEIGIPIDVITLQSDVELILMPVDSNVAIMSKTDPKQSSSSGTASDTSNRLLATYRCEGENVSRLQMKIRTLEGQAGTLRAFVVPKLYPKTCQCATFDIKPLSLHDRVASVHPSVLARPMNRLRLSGSFSMADIHTWLFAVLPNLPPNCHSDSAIFYFVSSFLGTVLKCEYRKGEALFESDSVSVIAILKQELSRSATKNNCQIRGAPDIDRNSIVGFLDLIRPKLEHHFQLSRKFGLIACLKEIEMQEGNAVFFEDDYQEILRDQDKISEEHQNSPHHVEFLRNILVTALKDYHRLRSKSLGDKLARLESALDNFSFDDLVAVFKDDH